MDRLVKINEKSVSVRSLSDHELRAALKDHGVSPGPITDSTRELYRKKLESILEDNEEEPTTEERGAESELEDESSDEPFEVDEEELNESSDSYSEETEEHNEEEEVSEDSQDYPQAHQSPSKVKFYFVSLISLLVVTISIYLYTNNNLKIYKNLTRQLLILLTLSPIGYIIYRTYRFYMARRYEENKRVCELVSEALELLQSPENPKGLMPILHIRDTLLTPAERKAKKTIKVWQKVVKFIEEHESRVKVELVNIDGEDFRAWKWIGSRKLI